MIFKNDFIIFIYFLLLIFFLKELKAYEGVF